MSCRGAELNDCKHHRARSMPFYILRSRWGGVVQAHKVQVTKDAGIGSRRHIKPLHVPESALFRPLDVFSAPGDV